MTLRRKLIHLLDRPIGRPLLSHLTNRYLKSKLRMDADVRWDDVWIHRFGRDFFVDQPRYNYYRDNFMQWPRQAEKIFKDHEDYWFHAYRPQPGDTVVDIGAGLGTDSMIFSRAVGPTGTVIAVEAHPRTYRNLIKTCTLNRLDNVKAVNSAIMDRACTVYIEDQSDHEGNSVSTAPSAERLPTGIPAISIDELCRQHGVERIDLLKMNIEGAERFAIEGMKEMGGKTRAICIACHDFRSATGEGYRTREPVVEFLTRNGFRIIERPDDPRHYVRDHIHGVRA